MLMRHAFVAAMLVAALVYASAGCGEGGGTPPGPPDASPDASVDAGVDAAPVPSIPCPLLIEDESTPGYPFDLQIFENQLLPDLQTTCGTAGCHRAPYAAGGYGVWFAGESPCVVVDSFHELYERVDFRINPANSLIIRNMDGTDPHPVQYRDDPLLAGIRDFVEAAHLEYTGGNGGDLTGFFDANAYATQIQPVVDGQGCTGARCHNETDNAGSLGLHPGAAFGTLAFQENLARLTSYVDQDAATAETTVLYLRASDQHGGVTLGFDGMNALTRWIQDALDRLGGPGNPVSCAPGARFDVDLFRAEIEPLIEGRVDYNDIDSGRTSVGCARAECHGSNRGAGTLHLDPAGTPEQQLDSLRCFVDLKNPPASQALLCPLNLDGCRKRPHPGADIFFGVNDRNYQKLLSFIYATEHGNTPLDFAFFARKINPIFDDPDAVQDGAPGLTCASLSCHGSSNGQTDSGASFPIIAGATDPADLFINFIAAARFTHAEDAGRSSLLMYPTNEVASPVNPLATGQQHPGGACFAAGDQEALDLLKFAGGIRPNAQGFLQDFLVAGLFSAADVTDDALFKEATVEPKIFDRSGQGQQFNQGLWDGFFSGDENIDLLQAFQVADAIDQLAYAVAYVINTTPNAIETVITVRSDNDVELMAGSASAVGRGGQGVSLPVTLAPFQHTKEVTRIMLKVFQQVGEESFAFSIQFTDENGNLLTDATRELVFVLAKNAGGL